MSARIKAEIWDDLEAAGGQRVARLQVVAGSMTRNIDNTDQLRLEALNSTEWVGTTQLRHVIRTEDHNGTVTEWRVSEIARRRGAEEGIVGLRGVSPIQDLGQAVVADVSTGGQQYLNLGGIGLTPAQYLETFATPALEREDIDYVTLGTVEPDGRIDMAWDRWTALQLARELESRSGGELEYARSSSGYTLHLWTARGSTAPVRLLRVGRNVEVLTWRRQLGALRTVVVPGGQVVTGAVEAASIAQAAWLVTAVTGGTSGGTYTVADPVDDDPPIAFNDQVTGLWLLGPTAELVQVTSSSTSQVVRFDATDELLSTGMHIEFRSSSDGNWLLELTNPAAVAKYGRVVGTLDDGQGRGERNHVRNGLWTQWAELPFVSPIQAASSGSGNTVAVQGLQPSQEIFAGDVLHANVAQQFANDMRITADTVASTAGATTLTLNSTAYSFAANQKLWLFHQSSARAPNGYAHGSTAQAPAILLQRRDMTVSGTLTGESDGANSNSTAPVFHIRGLPENAEIYAGDLLTLGVQTQRIMGSVVATSSGAASVALHTGLNSTDGAAITITRPTIAQDAAVNGAVLMMQHAFAGIEPYLESPRYRVRYDSTLPMLWMRAGVTVHKLTAVSSSSTQGDNFGGIVRLWDAGSSGAIATVADNARTLAAQSVTDVLLSAGVELSADTTLTVRYEPPTWTGGNVAINPDPFVYLRFVQLTLGPDPEVPAVEGSHANRLWHLGNRKLRDLSVDPDVFEVEITDLSALDGWTSTDESLMLGQVVRVLDGELGIDSQVRVVEVGQDLADASNMRVVLANRPALITELLAKQKGQSRITVAIDVAGTTSTGGTAGGGVGGPTSTDSDIRIGTTTVVLGSPNEDAAKRPGAIRAVVSYDPTAPTTGLVARRVFGLL